eukprot:EG_transcript_6993
MDITSASSMAARPWMQDLNASGSLCSETVVCRDPRDAELAALHEELGRRAAEEQRLRARLLEYERQLQALQPPQCGSPAPERAASSDNPLEESLQRTPSSLESSSRRARIAVAPVAFTPFPGPGPPNPLSPGAPAAVVDPATAQHLLRRQAAMQARAQQMRSAELNARRLRILAANRQMAAESDELGSILDHDDRDEMGSPAASFFGSHFSPSCSLAPGSKPKEEVSSLALLPFLGGGPPPPVPGPAVGDAPTGVRPDSALAVGRSIGELSARCSALEKELATVVHRLHAKEQRDRAATSVVSAVSLHPTVAPSSVVPPMTADVVRPCVAACGQQPETAGGAAKSEPATARGPESQPTRSGPVTTSGSVRKAPSPQPLGRIFTSISEDATALPYNQLSYRPISAPCPTASNKHHPRGTYPGVSGPQPKPGLRPAPTTHRRLGRSSSPGPGGPPSLRTRRGPPRRMLAGEWQAEEHEAEVGRDSPEKRYVVAATLVRGRHSTHKSRLTEALQFVHAMLDAVEIGSPTKGRPR